MFPDLTQAPVSTPLYIALISGRRLKAQLEAVGIGEGTALKKLRTRSPLPPLLVRGAETEIVLSGAMAAGTVVSAGHHRQLSLAGLAPGESGEIRHFIDGGDLAQVFTNLGFPVGRAIAVSRKLPQLDYITLIDAAHKVRLSIDAAARIWGKLPHRQAQFAAAFLNQPFEVKKILGKLDVGAPGYSTGLVPGIRMVLSGLEKSPPTPGETNGTVIASNHIALHLPESLAAAVLVRQCDICWSCGQCHPDI